MATEADIEVIEDNDPVVVFICRMDGATVDLTGALIEFYLKAAKATEEDDAGVIKYSTTGGEITILPQGEDEETNGQCQVFMKATDLPEPVKKRYRMDITQNGRKLTYAYGRLVVIDV